MRLKSELYKWDIKIAEFTLDFNLVDLFASKINIINKDLFPVTNDDNHSIEDNFTNWLRRRAEKINKNTTDEEIISFYGCVYKHTFGRMTPYIIGKSVLQYMNYDLDEYHISPVNTHLIYFGDADERFARMFIFKPYNKIKDMIDEDIYT